MLEIPSPNDLYNDPFYPLPHGKKRDFFEQESVKGGGEVLEKLLFTQKLIAHAKEKTVIFSSPIVLQNNNPVFFPRTINVLQGKAGVHKSRLAECICASLLKRADCKRELLGFKAETLKQFAVCYVDTERNLTEQLPYALQQIQLKAGFDITDNPANFDYISLLEFDRDGRFEVLDIYLSHIRKKYSVHLFVVLDVVTDCVFNFNDARDSMRLIDMMNRTINRYDVTFLCLIHENPGSIDKARGHLGTELTNKASTVLQVGFENVGGKASSIIKVSYLKCRSTAKHEPFYVEYSNLEKGLVLADLEKVNEMEETKKQKSWQESFCEILSVVLQTPLPRKQLYDRLISEFNCSEKTIDRRLKELIQNKVSFLALSGEKVMLHKEINGLETSFSLLETEDLDCPF